MQKVAKLAGCVRVCVCVWQSLSHHLTKFIGMSMDGYRQELVCIPLSYLHLGELLNNSIELESDNLKKGTVD